MPYRSRYCLTVLRFGFAPIRRAQYLQADALATKLGHALGIWGHSDRANRCQVLLTDALPKPVLAPTRFERRSSGSTNSQHAWIRHWFNDTLQSLFVL